MFQKLKLHKRKRVYTTILISQLALGAVALQHVQRAVHKVHIITLLPCRMLYNSEVLEHETYLK